jgi:hypothetical protein
MSVHPASLHEADRDRIIALNTFVSLFLGKGRGQAARERRLGPQAPGT